MTSYRADIDGLRAFAVLIVVFFHLGISKFSGGFIGVDIFFVLSGYLITGNLFREYKEKGKISLKSFYARRAKRLLPALYCVVFVSFVIGNLIFTPELRENLNTSSIYSVLSVSNIYFWSESGYFSRLSELKPLLHTWSLSVEEQFYLLWPLVVLLIASIKKRKVAILGLVFLLVSSFLVLFLFDFKSDTLFFLTPFRIFEFCFGAIVYFINVELNRRLSTIISLVGFSLLGYSLIVIDKTMVSPGIISLIPCFGTVLVIVTKNSYLNKIFLSNPLAVYFGKRSYSLYLVHWPIIVYYKFFLNSDYLMLEKVFLFHLCIVFSELLYRVVERKFRYANVNLIKTFTIYICSSITLILVFLITNTFVTKSSSNILKNRKYGGYECESPCVIGDSDQKDIVYVVGDSFSRQLKYGLEEVFPGIRFKVFDHGSCTFFSREWVRYVTEKTKARCLLQRKEFFSLLEEDKPKKVIFANNWVRINYFKVKGNSIVHKNFTPYYSSEKLDFIEKEISDFSKRYKIEDILIIGNTPRISFESLEKCIEGTTFYKYLSLKLGIFSNRFGHQINKGCHEFNVNNFLNPNRDYIKNISSFDMLDPFEYFCDSDSKTCKIIHSAKLLYSDSDHLSQDGSIYLVKKSKEKLKVFLEK